MDNQPPSSPPDNSQPVAYDHEGRPLYAVPPAHLAADPPQSQFVHMRRAVSPEKPHISDEVKAKHDASAKQYPFLNLSDGEFVINEVRRHPIGLLIPLGLSTFMITLILSVVINYPYMANSIGMMNSPSYELVLLIGGLLTILFGVGAYIAAWVYMNNKFFLTNESVIQEIQTSIFSRKEQTVSLANIEDASYNQKGFLQSMLNYGSIRLSTEGDETTYRFEYVARPKQQIATLNNAVEAFKNGRPIEDN